MLLVTHDVDEAIALGDRILVMRDGRIASEHRVDLDLGEPSQGTARDEFRVALLSEIGLGRTRPDRSRALRPQPNSRQRASVT